MAKTRARLDDHTLEGMVEDMISDAVALDDGERKTRRELALAYQAGEMPDLVAGEDQSSVVSHDLADALSMTIPSMMRVFCATDRIGIYEPERPGDEEFSEQATDYVNFVLLRECEGESLIRDGIHDGFLLGNGIIKHWWDDAEEWRVHSFTDLDDDAFVELVSDDDVELLEHTERPAPVEETQSGVAGGVAPTDGLAEAGIGGPPPQGPEAAGYPAGLPVQAPPPNPMAAEGMAPSGVSLNGLGQGTSQPPSGGRGMAGGISGAIPGADGGGMPPASGDANGQDISALLGLSGGEAGMGGGQLLGIGGSFGPPPLLHDVKIRRLVSRGRLRVKAVPDEHFFIESEATGLNERECRFCAHRDLPTRSDLIERGFDYETVWDLPSLSESVDDNYRNQQTFPGTDDYDDKAGERVEVYECYAKLDRTGDGIATWHQVMMAGSSGAQKLLAIEEWSGMLPFSDIVPDPIPHRWKGRSYYDRLREVQRVNTVLMRKTLDNLYQTVEPMRAANMSAIENPDALFDLRLGGIIRIKNGVDPRTAILDLTVPFVAKEAMPMVQEMRQVAERRVGVGEQSSGLDADALTGQVATAVTATQSASGLRKEDYARNIQVGLKRVFRAMLHLIVEHQDRERTLRLRDKWVPIDPRTWNSAMDVTINVGLGAGNRDRDLAMLQGVTGKMEMIMRVMGPNNPLCGVEQYFQALRMMVEAAGIKSPERFFPEITDEVKQKMAAEAQAAGQKPDPKMMEAQAHLKIAEGKAQFQAQMDVQRAGLDVQMQQNKLAAEIEGRREEAAHKMQMERERAANDLQVAREKAALEAQLMREKAAFELQTAREKATLEAELKREELAAEIDLKRMQIIAGMTAPNPTNLEAPQ